MEVKVKKLYVVIFFMHRVLLTNDDGIHSAPFKALWKALIEKGFNVSVVVPEREMSAAGKGITLHKPLRIWRIPTKVGGTYKIAHLVSGTPGDTVTVALRYLLEDKPEAVLSGINVGDNMTVDNIFTSGTIAAAIQAALMGFKSAAFSVEIPQNEEPRPADKFRIHALIATEIAEWVLENGLPDGVDLLNVNFPFKISDDTPVRLTKLAKVKFENYVLERVDPRGKPYYWIGSNPIAISEEMRGTDYYALTVEKAISITPIGLNFISPLEERKADREVIVDKMNDLISVISNLVISLR
jgi:5'/3'-nucleotidase SurE